MDQQIWQWTLTKEAIAPCFVRDVLAMHPHRNGGADFFWLGHTPCRTVLLVGMVVGIQLYDKRAIYTIDDGTAVIDCVLRYLPASRPFPRSMEVQCSKPLLQIPSPKKPHLDKATLRSTEPPPPITEPGYPVQVVGKVVRHYQSKQIYADTIDPCISSLDEISHLERVIELHKTKYSLAVPFVPPPKHTSRPPPLDTSTSHASAHVDANVFSNTSLPLRPSTDATLYVLSPPPMPIPLQGRNHHLPSAATNGHHDHTHVPSSPTASSIASSTPSSPCKPSSPVKAREVSPCTAHRALLDPQAARKPKMRHPSRLHSRDLTGNTFRLYVKYYMDNAPPPFPVSSSSPVWSVCGQASTPRKRAENEDGTDDLTPRPLPGVRSKGNEDGPTLGFTLSHLRRVPELALLAARVVRAEARRRDKANRVKEPENSHWRNPSASSASMSPGNGACADSPRKKMKRLFSWAVVKLYEEGSIVLWDGEVRPLPVLPPPLLGLERADGGECGLWKGDDAQSMFGDPSVSCPRSYVASVSGDPSPCTSVSASVLYTSSASASLYSHYHSPRRSTKRGQADGGHGAHIDLDADPGYVSDPGMDEEAYVPLSPQLLARYVREAVGALRRRRGCGAASVGGRGKEPTPEDILTYLQRTDGRWARVGIWVVEEALAVLKQ